MHPSEVATRRMAEAISVLTVLTLRSELVYYSLPWRATGRRRAFTTQAVYHRDSLHEVHLSYCNSVSVRLPTVYLQRVTRAKKVAGHEEINR